MGKVIYLNKDGRAPRVEVHSDNQLVNITEVVRSHPELIFKAICGVEMSAEEARRYVASQASEFVKMMCE